jgi:hypothetical protein
VEDAVVLGAAVEATTVLGATTEASVVAPPLPPLIVALPVVHVALVGAAACNFIFV